MALFKPDGSPLTITYEEESVNKVFARAQAKSYKTKEKAIARMRDPFAELRAGE
jgi:hypothetical protein